MDWRPWHGSENPFESLYQHFKAEIARLESLIPGMPIRSIPSQLSADPERIAQAEVVDSIDGQTLVPEGSDAAPAS